MGFITYLRDLISPSQKSTPDGFTATWLNPHSSDSSINQGNLLLNNKEWVFIAVDKVASAAASVRLKAMKYSRNGDDQEVFDGPLVQFLEKPGAGLTGKDFVYLNTTYKELTGNAFWRKEKARRLSPLIPTLVYPELKDGNFIGYRYKNQVIAIDDVLHDRYIDPQKPYWGIGKLEKIARWVDTSSFSNEFLRRFFLNGATFGGFIETEEESEDRIKLIKAGLANDHVGVANAHKTGVLPKGAKYQRVTGNMNEIEMGATDDRYRDKILAGFGVPKTLVGLTTEVNRASAEAAEYVFARYTVKPIIEDLISFLNVHIAPLLDPTSKFYFDYEEFVPTNLELELREREIALAKQPYKTVNEVRAEVGLPPVQGGDIVFGNPFQVPLGQPQAAPEPANDDEEDEEPPAPAKGRRKAIPGHVRQAAKRHQALDTLAKEITGKVAEQLEETKDLDAEAHKDFVGRVDKFSDQLEQRVKDFNSRQQSQVIQDLTAITKAVSKADLYDMDKEIDIMVDFVTPILAGLLTEQAIAEFEAQGFAGRFDSGAELVQRTVETAARRMAKSYNNTTAKLLKQKLNEGIQNGDSLAELTKKVQEVYAFSDQVRAKAVAHTESFYIANRANMEAYRQSGVVGGKRWYTAEDELVCPYCQPMQGRIVGVEDSYFTKGQEMIGNDGTVLKLDYRSIDVPPLHTRCRCFIRPANISIGD